MNSNPTATLTSAVTSITVSEEVNANVRGDGWLRVIARDMLVEKSHVGMYCECLLEIVGWVPLESVIDSGITGTLARIVEREGVSEVLQVLFSRNVAAPQERLRWDALVGPFVENGGIDFLISLWQKGVEVSQVAIAFGKNFVKTQVWHAQFLEFMTCIDATAFWREWFKRIAESTCDDSQKNILDQVICALCKRKISRELLKQISQLRVCFLLNSASNCF